MKIDLATAILAGIAGVVIAYLAVTFLMPETASVDFRVLGTSVSYDLTQPDNEIFNYRAVNPTVEVYVGECKKYNEKNECIDDQNQIEERDEDETGNEAENESESENTNDQNGNVEAED